MATREDRDALLDQLSKDIDKWAEQETKAVEAEISVVKALVDARSTTQKLVANNAISARVRLVDDITTFLAGEDGG